MDAIGPLPMTARGNYYVLTAVDYLTRWAEARAVRAVNAKTVCKFVYEDVCCRFGVPLELVSDRGQSFRSDFMDMLCDKLKMKHMYSSPWYPQCNGMNEHFNGECISIIGKIMQTHEKSWDLALHQALWAYRVAVKEGTQFPPFHLVYGKEAL